MKGYLKSLEYWLPLITNLPTGLRVAIVIWFISTLVLFSIIGYINYTKNRENASKQEELKIETAKIQINRYLDDYIREINQIMDKHEKESLRIIAEHSGRGTGRSSMVVDDLIALAKTNKDNIDVRFINLNRDIEDFLLKYFSISSLKKIKDLSEESNRFYLEKSRQKEVYEDLEKTPKDRDVTIYGKPTRTKDFKLQGSRGRFSLP